MADATPWILYDWPADGVDPFDPAAGEPMWLLDGGWGWGRGWPAGDLRDFGSWGDFAERVGPMGYRVLQVRERVALVAGGELVHASPRSASPTWRGPWGRVGHLPYGVRSRDGSESQAACPSEGEALEEAARLSRAEPDGIWLVSRRIAIVDWH